MQSDDPLFLLVRHCHSGKLAAVPLQFDALDTLDSLPYRDQHFADGDPVTLRQVPAKDEADAMAKWEEAIPCVLPAWDEHSWPPGPDDPTIIGTLHRALEVALSLDGTVPARSKRSALSYIETRLRDGADFGKGLMNVLRFVRGT